MRILILGGDGMLGHRLLLSLRERHETRVTLRQSRPAYDRFGLFTPENSVYGVDVLHTDALLRVLAEFRPQAVVNAVGIVKQRATAKEYLPSLEVNSVLPHRLALLCAAAGTRLIHFSTDCVFSGRVGGYSERDFADADDLYGRSKLLGETVEDNALTIRSSIIGMELRNKTGLVEWFLAQKGEIKGFRKAIFSGLTTSEMARVVEKVLLDHPTLSGVWHIASEPISKHDLLTRLCDALGRRDVRIVPDDEFSCDRSLDDGAFRKRTGYVAPPWPAMLDELAAQIRSRKEG